MNKKIGRAVILAAGQGTRMRPLTDDRPKVLLPIADSTVITRIIGQLVLRGIKEVIVVVGFEKEKVIKELNSIDTYNCKIITVENDRFQEDVNIYSTYKALELSDEPFFLFEGDILFDDFAVDKILQSAASGKSVWYTTDFFNSTQYGGILKADLEGKIEEIRIVPEFEPRFEGYKKLLGVMAIGPREITKFKELVAQYVSESINQYYLIPWIEHLAELECIECDLAPTKSCSFNSPADFERACRMILEK